LTVCRYFYNAPHSSSTSKETIHDEIYFHFHQRGVPWCMRIAIPQSRRRRMQLPVTLPIRRAGNRCQDEYSFAGGVVFVSRIADESDANKRLQEEETEINWRQSESREKRGVLLHRSGLMAKWLDRLIKNCCV
jgi:hypothetical protein